MLTRNQLHKKILDATMEVVSKLETGLKVNEKDVIAEIFETNEKDTDPYVFSSLNALISNYEKYVNELSKYLKGWDFIRLSDITKSILLMSLVHKDVEPKVAKAIIINIAVKFSKIYGDKDEYKFINGVLENALK